MITRAFDLFFAPFAGHPWLGLAAISLVTGLVALLVFRYTSNQRRIQEVKRQIIAHLLEVWLYRDEMSVVLRAQGAILRDNLRYLGLALVPLACMLLPMAALLIHTDLRYGHRALAVGERAIVAVKLPFGVSPEDVKLTAPEGIAVDTPAVRIPSEGEVDWRLRATARGRHALRFTVGSAEVTKEVVVGEPMARLSAARVRGGVAHFLHPGEPPLPAGAPVQSISITYPESSLSLLGRTMHWIWPWLVLSMGFGYALKGPLRVQI